MTRAVFDVGIDLGTTHTVVAYSEGAAPGARVRVLPLPQLVSASEVLALDLLPSFLYAPLSDEPAADPWGELPWLVGSYARRRGEEVSERLVASAKSWLSHAGVARRDAILPWGADAAQVPKLSPVEASRRILTHAAQAWNGAFPEHPLAEQNVVLTVPASFDEVARELTVEAAERAGLSVRLLEEPQAAFYDLIAAERRSALEALLDAGRSSVRVLVCDVGGGTTDLTLIEARRSASSELELERVAVGRHLLLGGDNIDLALAQICEQRLSPGEHLDAFRFSRLLLACRSAKETLLGAAPAESAAIRVLRAGSALVGGTLSTELSRAEVEDLLLTGFLPVVQETQPTRARAGLVAFGLPYERDPAISRHVVQFLARQAGAGVDALLLNGGLFHAPKAAERLHEVVSAWSGREVALLPYPEPDLSVARGAVAFARALHGSGLRIGSGTAQGFYVSVDDPSARRALCVVPKGAREGEPHQARAGGLWLRVGQSVRLELHTSDRADHRPGDLVTLDDSFTALPPVTTVFATDAARESQTDVEVALEGELSAIGTVELACVELTSAPGRAPRRFRLAFDLRAETTRADAPPTPAPPEPERPRPPRLSEALAAIRNAYGASRPDASEREAKDLPRELERLLGERREWTLETSRALFDALSEGRAARRRSEDHERIFWMLAGYCLRPGFGAPHDGERLGQLVPLFEAGVSASSKARSWQQFWIAWRRIAAGLREETQTRFFGLLEPFWAPAESKLKRSKSLKPAEPSYEMLMLITSLERVPAERRKALGDWLVDRTFNDRDPHLWSALGRIGARAPGYASAHHVVPPSAAEAWLTHLLSERWHEVPTAAATAAQLARFTGDRARDVSNATRAEVVRRLTAVQAAPELIASVRELLAATEADRVAWLGEELPLGLRLELPSS